MATFKKGFFLFTLLTIIISFGLINCGGDGGGVEVKGFTISPEQLLVSCNVGTQATELLTIKSRSSEEYNFSFVASSDIISFTPASGTTPLAVAVNIDCSGLIAGSRTEIIYAKKDLEEAQILVVIQVNDPANDAHLVLSDTSVELKCIENGSDSESIHTSSTGDPISFTTSENTAWLSLTPSSGQSGNDVLIEANCSGLTEGDYNASILFSGNGDTHTVDVALEVTAVDPGFAVTPLSITAHCYEGFLVNPAPQISVTNGGVGPEANWSASSNALWMVPSAASGTSPSTVYLNINCAELAVGDYQGSVTFNGAGQTMTVDVDLSVTLLPAPTNFRVVEDSNPPDYHFDFYWDPPAFSPEAVIGYNVYKSNNGNPYTSTFTTSETYGTSLFCKDSSWNETVSVYVTAVYEGNLEGAHTPTRTGRCGPD